jgi:hypothetical protein
MYVLDMPIKTMWSEVQQVRERTRAILADLPDDLRDAAEMTVSELVENAIKYGQSVPDAPDAGVRIERRDDRLEIVVTNGVASDETLHELKKHVDRIATATDRMSLYVERLQELMRSGGLDGSKLGLYRIFCEGGFDVRCEVVGRVVTISASRQVTKV